MPLSLAWLPVRTTSTDARASGLDAATSAKSRTRSARSQVVEDVYQASIGPAGPTSPTAEPCDEDDHGVNRSHAGDEYRRHANPAALDRPRRDRARGTQRVGWRWFRAVRGRRRRRIRGRGMREAARQ